MQNSRGHTNVKTWAVLVAILLFAGSCRSEQGEAVALFESLDLPFTVLAEGTDEDNPYSFVGLEATFEEAEQRLVQVFEQNGWVVTRRGGGVVWAQSPDGQNCVSYNDLSRAKQRLALGYILERDHPKALLDSEGYQSAVLAMAFTCT